MAGSRTNSGLPQVHSNHASTFAPGIPELPNPSPTLICAFGFPAPGPFPRPAGRCFRSPARIPRA